MHINTLHSVLKKFGLQRKKRQSTGLVKGYHPVKSDGYVITERKEDNPEWLGFGQRSRLPKFLPTGIFEIDPGPYGAETVKLALTQSGIAFSHVVGERLVIVQAAHRPT